MTPSSVSKAARAVFLLLHIEGLRLALDGDQLTVRPASRITDQLRELIRLHRDELLRLTADGSEGFDPRAFPETVKILAEFRRVFGPGCRLHFANEDGGIFGEPSSPGVPVSEPSPWTATCLDNNSMKHPRRPDAGTRTRGAPR